MPPRRLVSGPRSQYIHRVPAGSRQRGQLCPVLPRLSASPSRTRQTETREELTRKSPHVTPGSYEEALRPLPGGAWLGPALVVGFSRRLDSAVNQKRVAVGRIIARGQPDNLLSARLCTCNQEERARPPLSAKGSLACRGRVGAWPGPSLAFRSRLERGKRAPVRPSRRFCGSASIWILGSRKRDCRLCRGGRPACLRLCFPFPRHGARGGLFEVRTGDFPTPGSNAGGGGDAPSLDRFCALC